MPINTKNSGSLTGSVAESGATRRVTFRKQTYVSSLGRNSAIGETAYVSDGDARFLIAYKYAVKADEPAPELNATGITFTGADNKEESSSSSGVEAQATGITFTGADLAEAETTEPIAEGDEPERQFPGRRRRRG